jgi:hypothetical protein
MPVVERALNRLYADKTPTRLRLRLALLCPAFFISSRLLARTPLLRHYPPRLLLVSRPAGAPLVRCAPVHRHHRGLTSFDPSAEVARCRVPPKQFHFAHADMPCLH